MMAADISAKQSRFSDWLSNETEFDLMIARLVDAPASGIAAWSRTSSGVIAMLFILQFATGILLGFHFVPSSNDAYTTVSYIELAVRNGAWIRSLHYHSSVLLPIVLVFHLLQMLVRRVLSTNKTAWVFGITALALALAAGATGYALPWDARALNGVNIAASLAGNLPFIGAAARSWIVDGSTITTLTLSRFYALHVWVVPLLILLSAIARIVFFGKRRAADRKQILDWARSQFARNAVAVGLVFLGLTVFSTVYPAPFGPQSSEASTYLPRPGPQFLWLFEMQKYTDGTVAAVFAMGFPTLLIVCLLALPFLLGKKIDVLRVAAGVVYAAGFGTAGLLTVAAIFQDMSDPKISAQLADQRADEAKFRASIFEPKFRQDSRQTEAETTPDDNIVRASAESPLPIAIPTTYAANCSKCHGAHGEGTEKFPELTGLTTREEDQLSPEMILAIIDDPKKVGRSSKMPAYKHKLSDDQKQELVVWIRSLSPETGDWPVQTARVEPRPN